MYWPGDTLIVSNVAREAKRVVTPGIEYRPLKRKKQKKRRKDVLNLLLPSRGYLELFFSVAWSREVKRDRLLLRLLYVLQMSSEKKRRDGGRERERE